MSSAHQRMLHHNGSASKSVITWLVFIIIMLYFLHSSSDLFVSTFDNPHCPNTLDLATSENLLHTSNTTIQIEEKTELNEEKTEDEEPEDIEPEQIVIPLPPETPRVPPTKLKHVVFGIAASSNLWNHRKEYIKTWWRPGETRGVVWLDKRVRVQSNEALPQIRISADTSRFKYRNRQGDRSALRISRVVSETLKLGMKDVRWFVMGDDDTVFVADNVVRILSKYDHRQYYYVGSSSESHVQNIHFSYAMAYGGGGFAISYPLAKELSKMQDRCIQRYPNLYGSDDRIQACMAELGVPLTKEPGFHQVYLITIALKSKEGSNYFNYTCSCP